MRHLPIALPVAREAFGGAGRVYVSGFHHAVHASPLATFEIKEGRLGSIANFCAAFCAVALVVTYYRVIKIRRDVAEIKELLRSTDRCRR